ncbi:hypothetical protein HELRODRAFT_162971 [Helobdella robusta]|uniref:Uncharacterized protein n=1 Tax=Helobdella robusta TaxID=6412 RepID=T1ETG6_HELRO|nr:hypothetical protein HELRODRAFT_162971 [Helobdella robusta]ESN99423.1 hypothetical protein HELRODRAFT_162971 [Helobdella robusta]
MPALKEFNTTSLKKKLRHERGSLMKNEIDLYEFDFPDLMKEHEVIIENNKETITQNPEVLGSLSLAYSTTYNYICDCKSIIPMEARVDCDARVNSDARVVVKNLESPY